jgi:hypothetical protein
MSYHNTGRLAQHLLGCEAKTSSKECKETAREVVKMREPVRSVKLDVWCGVFSFLSAMKKGIKAHPSRNLLHRAGTEKIATGMGCVPET